MKNFAKLLCLMIAGTALATPAFAEDASKTVTAVVRKFSQAVACQTDQMPVVRVATLQPNEDGYGGVYVAQWYGDVGCMGGNGTLTPQFSILTQSGFSASTTTPVVVLGLQEPDSKIVLVNSLKAVNGMVYVTGQRYGNNDQQGSPTMKVSETYRYVEGKGLVRVK